MNLFDKIDLYYKKAQEFDTGVLKNAPGPSKAIRAAAKSALIQLISNQSVPMEEKKNPNTLGGYLRDFVNGRFSDNDLNMHWDHYLAALMGKINARVKNASTKELGDFYKGLFNILSSAWDTIANSTSTMGGGEAGRGEAGDELSKPMAAEWVGASEDPWAKKYKDPMSDVNMKALVNKREEEAAKGTGYLKTNRQDALIKAALINKYSK